MRRLPLPEEALRTVLDCSPAGGFEGVRLGAVASVVDGWRPVADRSSDAVGSAAALARALLGQRVPLAEPVTLAPLTRRLVELVLDTRDLRLARAGRDEVDGWRRSLDVDAAAISRLRAGVRSCVPRPSAWVGLARPDRPGPIFDARADVGHGAAAAMRRLGLEVTVGHANEVEDVEVLLAEERAKRAADLAAVVLDDAAASAAEQLGHGRPDALLIALAGAGPAAPRTIVVDGPEDAFARVTAAVESRRRDLATAASRRLLSPLVDAASVLTDAEWLALDTASELGGWPPGDRLSLAVLAQTLTVPATRTRRRLRLNAVEPWERLRLAEVLDPVA